VTLLENHHKVIITSDRCGTPVGSLRRHRQRAELPESRERLDTACARVAIGLTTSPPSVEEATRRIGQIERELKVLERSP